MHGLYELKDKLINDLAEYGTKKTTDGSWLEVVDKLAHATKNVCKVIEDMEGGASYDGSYRGSYAGGYSRMSYARGRGRNAARDSMGRYSSANGEVAEQLREIMREVSDSRTQQVIQEAIDQVENTGR